MAAWLRSSTPVVPAGPCPLVAAAALVGVGPLVHAVTADAHGSLPPRTAAQLLADVSQAKVQALSGTVVETADLGLPALPALGGRGGNEASFSSMLSGSHTIAQDGLLLPAYRLRPTAGQIRKTCGVPAYLRVVIEKHRTQASRTMNAEPAQAAADRVN